MKMIFRTCLLAAWIFLPALTAPGGPARAQEQDMINPCDGQEGVLAVACRDARELLMTDTALPEAELSISVKGREGKWLYGFPSEDASAGIQADETCNHPGPLLLPRGVTVELQVTSDDDLYDWSVPALGIDTTGIPGRIATVLVKATETGNFTGTIKAGSPEAISGASGDVHVVATDAYEVWLTKERRRTCR